MAADEMFDIFNSAMEPIGIASRKDAHAQGLWHQTFHCWIVSRSGFGGGESEGEGEGEGEGHPRLLFQLRHKNKDAFPNLLDVSCAGHLLAGETAEDGLRELAEELGLTAVFHELTPCGLVTEENMLSDGQIDREFHHMFVYECNLPLSEYKPQLDEVSGLYWIRIRDFERLVTGAAGDAPSEGAVVNGDNGSMTADDKRWLASDFVPHSDIYYEALFRTLRDLDMEKAR